MPLWFPVITRHLWVTPTYKTIQSKQCPRYARDLEQEIQFEAVVGHRGNEILQTEQPHETNRYFGLYLKTHK